MIEVDGRKIDWYEGMTISELLAEIKDPHPYPVVRIGDTYVSRPNFEKTSVPDNSQVFLIPMIAGG
ncbi:MAG: MoaD/ThiS family protein [Desulfobacterales bacterium]|jgi:sulfur carrier protein ThiS